MPTRKPAPTSNNAGILFAVIILVLLLIAAYGAYRYSSTQSAPPSTAAASQPAPIDLVTDDRILFGGAPRATRPDLAFTTLKNIAYMVGYSEQRKDPLWSAYRVIRMEHPFNLPRPTGDFLTDNRTTARVAHHDFTGSGYDRGHMTPNSAIARCYGADAQKETFLLSNICPQAPNLNREVWEKLEKDEIEYAGQFEEVWVVDGPIFADLNGGTTHTLRSGIAVPASFYKIVLEDQGGKVRLFCVIMPQGVKGTELPQQFLTSVRQIEQQTGLEFLWKLDPQTRETLETQVGPMW
jgi:endonuclease G, mitochondrial